MMFELKDFINRIDTVSTSDLMKIQKAVKSELLQREKEKHNNVEHIPDYCDKETLAAVWSDCQSLVMTDSKRKTGSQWLSPLNEPYEYSDSNPIHNALDITQFKGISKLLQQINSDTRFVGPLNACLVLKYNSNLATTSIHADDEDYIDQNKSICDFSTGATRTLEFFEKAGKGKPVKNVPLVDNSIAHMKPGAQQLLKHMVRSEVLNPKLGGELDELRYSLSFRGLTKLRDDVSRVSDEQFKPPQPYGSEHHQQLQDHKPQRHTCLVVGDSYAAKLDPKLLGRNFLSVKNIAKGGATLGKVMEQLEVFAKGNEDVIVDKLLISVGTNDIRYCKNGISHLRGPLKQLCVRINELYPNSKVYFQSLLPLPCVNKYDWNTNTNVIEFNRLLYNECVFRRFYFMNAFVDFVRPCRNVWCPHLRKDELFEIGGIHPSPTWGMSVLAKRYIRALHSRFFDPCVFQ